MSTRLIAYVLTVLTPIPKSIMNAVSCAPSTRAGEHSTVTAWERVVEVDPEVLLVAPCGFGIERTLREVHVLAARPDWRHLRAVRSGRVVIADGNRYFNRSGPSVVDSIEILAEVLHPREFPPLQQVVAIVALGQRDGGRVALVSPG